MAKNKRKIFISIILSILLVIVAIIPKNITLNTLVIDNSNNDYTNMIFKNNSEELVFGEQDYIDNILNKIGNIEVRKVNCKIQKDSKIELSFFSEDTPKLLDINIYDKYIEIVSSIEGDYNKNIYKILELEELNNIITELNL